MPDRPRDIAELYEWHRPRTLDAGRMPDSPVASLALRYFGDVAGRRVDKGHFLTEWLARHRIVIATKD
jgi:hypothetical protein